MSGMSEDAGHDEEAIEAAERLLDEVDGALGRLEAGSFGTCEACGEEIDPDRLARHPVARTCGRHPQLLDPELVREPIPGDR